MIQNFNYASQRHQSNSHLTKRKFVCNLSQQKENWKSIENRSNEKFEVANDLQIKPVFFNSSNIINEQPKQTIFLQNLLCFFFNNSDMYKNKANLGNNRIRNMGIMSMISKHKRDIMNTNRLNHYSRERGLHLASLGYYERLENQYNNNMFSITNWKPLNIGGYTQKNSDNKKDMRSEEKTREFKMLKDEIKEEVELPLIKQNVSEEKVEDKESNKENDKVKDKEKKKESSLSKEKVKNILMQIPPPGYYTDDYYYYIIYPENCGSLIKKCISHRLKWKECHSPESSIFNLKWRDCSIGFHYGKLCEHNTIQMVNHYKFHSELSNKAKMFSNLFHYCEEINKEVFEYVPFTLILDLNDQTTFLLYEDHFKNLFTNIESYLFDYTSIKQKSFSRQKQSYYSLFPSNTFQKLGLKTNILIPHTFYSGKNYWIIKAPNLNRGRCIKVVDSIQKIHSFIKSISIGKMKGYSDEDKNDKLNKLSDLLYQSSIIIIQKYIEKPLLYRNRKCDIRVWVLISHKFKVYVFKEGHLKACSVDYNLENMNSFVHITNYSLQKYNENFSKFEKGNEISFDDFQKFLNEKYGDNSINIRNDIFQRIKEIIQVTVRSAKGKLNPNGDKYCFELFGYDFMMDEEFNVFLIEINTNPGLEESSDLIKVIIPRMIEDALRLTIDDLFETKYDKGWVDDKGEYKSLFHVEGYDDRENMWEYICDLNKSECIKEIKSDKVKINISKIKKKIKNKKSKKLQWE